MKYLLLALMCACVVEDSEPVYDYTCRLSFHCYNADSERLWYHATDFPITGTVDEVKEFSSTWSKTCSLLAIDYLQHYKCEFTLCRSNCEESNARTD